MSVMSVEGSKDDGEAIGRNTIDLNRWRHKSEGRPDYNGSAERKRKENCHSEAYRHDRTIKPCKKLTVKRSVFITTPYEE